MHRRQYQRFVVARFVARGELQVAVEIEAGVVFPACDDEALVGGVALVNDGVAVVALFSESGDAVGGEEGGGKRDEDEPAAQAQCGVTRQLAAEYAGGEQGDGGVQDAKEQRRARHAEARREQEREEERDGQRAEVVEGQHAGDEVGKSRLFAVQYAHHQRDFHADHGAGDEHEGIKQAAEGRGGKTKGDKQGKCRQPADDAHQQLDFDEAGERVFVPDVAGEVRTDAHREEVEADDAGELEDAVAEEIAGERGNDELIGEAATGDDEDGDDEGAVDVHGMLRTMLWVLAITAPIVHMHFGSVRWFQLSGPGCLPFGFSAVCHLALVWLGAVFTCPVLPVSQRRGECQTTCGYCALFTRAPFAVYLDKRDFIIPAFAVFGFDGNESAGFGFAVAIGDVIDGNAVETLIFFGLFAHDLARLTHLFFHAVCAEVMFLQKFRRGVCPCDDLLNVAIQGFGDIGFGEGFGVALFVAASADDKSEQGKGQNAQGFFHGCLRRFRRICRGDDSGFCRGVQTIRETPHDEALCSFCSTAVLGSGKR